MKQPRARIHNTFMTFSHRKGIGEIAYMIVTVALSQFFFFFHFSCYLEVSINIVFSEEHDK